MHTTTLNAIRSKHPCKDGWQKLLTHLGKTEADDEPLTLATVLESNGIRDAIWCLRAIDDDRNIRLFAVDCARTVRNLMTDSRSVAVLDVAERFANGLAAAGELTEARKNAAEAAAAAEAAEAAEAARAAAWAAAWAEAAEAARAAARAAAWAAAEAAEAEAARAAAWAAAAAAWAAARAEAEAEAEAAWQKIEQIYIERFCK